MRARIPAMTVAFVVFTAVAYAQPQSAPPSTVSTNPASSHIRQTRGTQRAAMQSSGCMGWTIRA